MLKAILENKYLSKMFMFALVLSTMIAGYAQQAKAYIFTATGITVEDADVTDVSNVSMNAVGSQFEILKFLGLFLLVWVAGYILSKILGIKIWGGSNGN